MSTAAVVHTPPPQGSSLVPSQSPRLGLLRPLASPAEIIVSQDEARALVAAALKEGRDYGKIPGVDKPSLLKPGAERLNLAFGCAARFKVTEQEFDHDRVVEWRKVKKEFTGPRGNRTLVGETESRGTSLGLYRYVVECEIVHRETGIVVAACLGSCSTMESKYIDRPRDSENTIIKMAEKRALVGATLLAYGLSEQFTQDVEDLPREAVAGDTVTDDDAVKCPTCKGPVWDNRATNDEREKAGKKRMPDYKCRDRGCEAVIWDAKKYAEELALNDAVSHPASTAAAPAAAAPTPAPPATESQIDKILDLCDHTALPDDLADMTRARIARGVTSARADEIIEGLGQVIAKVTPLPVPAAPDVPEGNVGGSPRSTNGEPRATAKAASGEATTATPAVQKATLALLTETVFRMLQDSAFDAAVRKRVRTRLAFEELTTEVLEGAIAEIEAGRLPF